MSRIAALLMVKNETARITVTLNSLLDVVDGLIVYDTGSTDDTVDVIREFCHKNFLSLHLLTGSFDNFATSRNKLLEVADSYDFDYYVLLDSNDEIKFTRKQLDNALRSGCDALMMKQRWFVSQHSSDIVYYNIKCIRSRFGFKYNAPVHEYLTCIFNFQLQKVDLEIYQNRVADNDGKTKNRWTRDLQILLIEINNCPTDGRTQYYLAQTYHCLNDTPNAFFWFQERARNTTGFQEERFLSFMKCSELTPEIDRKIIFNLEALTISHQAEPLVNLSKIFREKKQYLLAFSFGKMACDLKYPDTLLWFNKKCYDYDRWFELSITSYYVKEYDVGKKACNIVIASGINVDLHKKNLSFYEEAITELQFGKHCNIKCK